jgi:hypothetical protein
LAGYGLTIQAGAIALWKQFGPSAGLRWWLAIAIGLAALYGLVVLKMYATGLRKWRCRLDWIYQHYFDEDERDRLSLGKRWKYNEWVFLGGLSLTLVKNAGVTLGVLLSSGEADISASGLFRLSVCFLWCS